MLGYDYKEHIDMEANNAAKAEAIVGLEIPIDSVMEEFRRRMLADWRAEEIDQEPRSFPEAGGVAGHILGQAGQELLCAGTIGGWGWLTQRRSPKRG